MLPDEGRRATLEEFRPDTWEAPAKDAGAGLAFTRDLVPALSRVIHDEARMLRRAS